MGHLFSDDTSKPKDFFMGKFRVKIEFEFVGWVEWRMDGNDIAVQVLEGYAAKTYN